MSSIKSVKTKIRRGNTMVSDKLEDLDELIEMKRRVVNPKPRSLKKGYQMKKKLKLKKGGELKMAPLLENRRSSP